MIDLKEVTSEISSILDNCNLSLNDLVELTWSLYKQEYSRRPVTITEFIESDEYLGTYFKGEQSFYPFWMEKLKEIYPTEFHSPYYELIWELPIGSGKTLTATVIILYEIHKLQCLKRPRQLFSLAEGTRIVFSIFSRTLSISSDVNWEYFEAILSTSKYFLKYCPLPDGGRKVSTNSVVFPGNIAIDLGSQSSHALGKAVFGGILDEANFQRVPSGQAKEGYLALKRRRGSRFMGIGGNVPGKLILLSSPKVSTDFLEVQKKASRGIPSVQIIENTPIWDVRKGSKKDFYSGETFQIFVGSHTKDPYILSEKSNYSVTDEDIEYIKDIPVEYKNDFQSDLVSSLQDICGLSTSGVSGFISSTEKLNLACVMDKRVSKELIELDFYDKEDSVDKYVDTDYFKKVPFRESYRFIHIDLAKNGDKAAIASTFVRYDEEVVGIGFDKNSENKPVVAFDRTYYTEFLCYISAKHGQEIPLYKIKDFILFLKKIGYPIHIVSADQYQSVDLLQQLSLSGITTKTISVDRNRIPYMSARQLLYRGKLLVPNMDRLKSEFLGLVDDGVKIDHTLTSSKDGSDAVVGSVWNAINSDVLYTTSGLMDMVRPVKKDTVLEKTYDKISRENKIKELYSKLRYPI